MKFLFTLSGSLRIGPAHKGTTRPVYMDTPIINTFLEEVRSTN